MFVFTMSTAYFSSIGKFVFFVPGGGGCSSRECASQPVSAQTVDSRPISAINGDYDNH